MSEPEAQRLTTRENRKIQITNERKYKEKIDMDKNEKNFRIENILKYSAILLALAGGFWWKIHEFLNPYPDTSYIFMNLWLTPIF